MVQNTQYISDNKTRDALKYMLEKKIEEEIKKRCNRIEGVLRVTPLINIDKTTDGVYIIDIKVIVKTKKELINIHLIKKKIKEEINEIINHVAAPNILRVNVEFFP